MPPGAPPDGDFVLDGFAHELYGDVRDAGKPAAVIAITYYLSRGDAATPVPSGRASTGSACRRRGRRRAPMRPRWNAAFSGILAELARDLAAAELPK